MTIKMNSCDGYESFIKKLQACGINPSPEQCIVIKECCTEMQESSRSKELRRQSTNMAKDHFNEGNS